MMYQISSTISLSLLIKLIDILFCYMLNVFSELIKILFLIDFLCIICTSFYFYVMCKNPFSMAFAMSIKSRLFLITSLIFINESRTICLNLFVYYFPVEFTCIYYLLLIFIFFTILCIVSVMPSYLNVAIACAMYPEKVLGKNFINFFLNLCAKACLLSCQDAEK